MHRPDLPSNRPTVGPESGALRQAAAEPPPGSVIRRYAAQGPDASRGRRLTPHLRRLEAECIDIMREVAAEFAKPVMLYSIGKDSGVMLHLAMKAFFPAPAAFSAAARRYDLEVPRDDRVPRRRRRAAGPGAASSISTRTASTRGINPFASGSAAAHPGDEDRGAEAGARQITASMRPSAARAATRKKAAPRNASFPSAAPTTPGIPATNARNCGTLFNTRISQGEIDPRVSAVQLDRAGYLAIYRWPRKFRSCRSISPSSGRWWPRRRPDHGGRRAHAARARRDAGNATVRFRTLGCYPLTGAIESRRRRRGATLSPKC